jgi:NTE family protein
MAAVPDAPPRAIAEYEPNQLRSGIALCLSGGGYRAALFHLGGLRRLNELGVLGRVDTISSVSGGSVVAAYIARRIPWPLAAPVPQDEWEDQVAAPFRRLVRRNIRTWPMVKRYLLPWNWFGTSPDTDALAEELRAFVGDATLADLPARPRFVLSATDLTLGVNWVFERDRMGDYRAGYLRPHPADWPLASAVAASACFPPIFTPLRMPFEPERYRHGVYRAANRTEILRGLRLNDGGNYDNLGLEPVWKRCAVVLVSDGGSLLNAERDAGFILFRLRRYAGVIENQARALRKRWLIAGFLTRTLSGTFWGIAGARTSYDAHDSRGYSKAFAEEIIARIRTDFDSFSELEARVLENHGYLLADAAIRRHVPQLASSGPPPARPPFGGEYFDERILRRVLFASRRRTLLGRFPEGE